MVDVRWIQRLENLTKAFQTLQRAVRLAGERELSELEQQGLIQSFEFTHELAWKVLKDYLEEQGVLGIVGSKGATREAFGNGLIEDGDAWMDMIRARNLSSHTYDPDTAAAIAERILGDYYGAFEQMVETFTSLADAAKEEPCDSD